MKKKIVKNSKMSIDKLAVMVAKGFDNIEQKMATKDDIEGLKNQLEGANRRLDDISMSRVRYEDHDKLKARVSVIEKKLEIKH
jgi:hypothetical protein